MNARTRIKRLARKTICFQSRSFMHDTVIGLMLIHKSFNLCYT
ncbi:IS1 family transposase [Breznakiellaceae bacterium SP9]